MSAFVVASSPSRRDANKKGKNAGRISERQSNHQRETIGKEAVVGEQVFCGTSM